MTTSDHWYTPPEIIGRARVALGGSIDLDPASCDAANRVIGATTYYNEAINGLIQPWRGCIWLNPPYSRPAPWVDKLIAELPYIRRALVLVNNDTETKWFQRLVDHCDGAVFLNSRIRFWRADGRRATGARQGQAIFYWRAPLVRRAFTDIGIGMIGGWNDV